MGKMVRYLPNILTVARLCSLPFIVLLYSRDAPGASWTTAFVVLAAALSDIADGLIARRWQVQSEFGRWVDPIVDRAFFFTVVAMLWRFGTIPWLAALPLLVRDGLILALALPTRVYTSQKPDISRWGKASNLILMASLEWFIVDLRTLAWAFFAVGAVLYIASGLWYGSRAVMWVVGTHDGDHAGRAAAEE